MDCEQDNISSVPQAPDDESRSAVNSLILDYYKKFGRKRDLEQYFSLSTAQSDIRDPSSVFWARMKAENESSDSGERSENKKSDSSQELCRISIRFPAQDPSTSQDEDSKTKTESTSPPIIIEELPQDSRPNSEDEASKSEEEAIKSDDNHSQKSYDVLVDTSLKLHSPSSSITSQRRLEWDSLADVGYANESDRKTSASSLSTLERLALKQQYSNNDSQNNNLGVPTAHSTPLDENEAKPKSKKGIGKKSTKFYNKDVDFVEVNVPHSSNMNPPQSINVNLTKHISFNVEKDGKVTVDNVIKDISVSPEKKSIESESSVVKVDREMQTSLTKASHASNIPDNVEQAPQKIPILISLNTLRSRVRRKRLRMARRKLKTKKRADKENVPVQEKSGEQLSEAESFEYMPGHIYNQNQMTANNRPANTTSPNAAGNKSSLESSGILTSDSSKGSKHSFTKDLEKSINLLKTALNQRSNDSALRKQLIQQVCERLLNSRYRDDDSTTDFLSGLSFSSKKLGLGERNNTTTSTSDANNSAEKSKRPKKSILRTDKFNAGSIASTSQSVPNLPVASNSENLVTSNLAKNLTTSNTESDASSKEKTSSDNGFAKTSSEELYQKYLQALKREEAYKKHLKDKEMFLKQKLVCSDGAFKVPAKAEIKPNNRLKDLINDLTRNNYDDGSGDASKLEGGPSSNVDLNRFLSSRTERSQSVFTLSSGNTDAQNKKPNLKKKLQSDMKDLSKPGPSKDTHYCCCPHHANLKFTDSSVQVNIKNPCSNEGCPARKSKTDQPMSPRRSAKMITEDVTGNLKYICLCSKNVIEESPDDFLIYKCSRLNNKGIQLEETPSKPSNETYIQCNDATCTKKNIECVPPAQSLNNKSSQTNMLIKMLHEQPTDSFKSSSDQIQISGKIDNDAIPVKSTITIYEATRCIQTEISINPKISDPTLSDINIVSDCNCAKLISEHCREITKPSLTDVFSNQAVVSSSAFSDSYKSTGTSKDIGKKIKDNYNTDEIEQVRKENMVHLEANIGHSENFTIPIQGTNMTLMVSIGSEHAGFPDKSTKEMVTECIGTDKVNAIEQATSLREECSKGVQSDIISDHPKVNDHNTNKGCDFLHKPLMVNTCLTAPETKFGTYPQNSPVNDRKPFRRANTDTDKVAVNTRNIGAGESNTPTKSSIKTKTSYASSDYNPNQRDTCPCGCKGKKENCKLDCIERQLTLNRKTSFDKEISTQPDANYEKCACGCGGTINNCKEDCIERSTRLTPRDQNQDQKASNISTKKTCGTQPTEQTWTQTSESLERSDKCTCGCGGEKHKCKRSCKQRQSSPRNDIYENVKSCGTQPLNNQSNIEPFRKSKCEYTLDKIINDQTDMYLTQTQSELCSCGCGGPKNKCGKSCKKLDSSPRKDNKKQFTDRNIDTQTEPLPTQNEKCSCGCGALKYKCKKTCKELNSWPKSKSPNRKELCGKQSVDKATDAQTDSLTKYEKCSCGCGGEKDKCKKSCKENKKQCGTQSSREMDSQIEKCSCGCGGAINDCKADCKEKLKLSPRERSTYKIQKRDERIQDDVAYGPKSNNDMCPCGCGGVKNACKKSCKEVGTQKNSDESPKPCTSRNTEVQNVVDTEGCRPLKISESSEDKINLRSSDKSRKSSVENEQSDSNSDPILSLIQNITKKYTKTEIEKSKRKKCFKEIMTVLNYLLDTEESPDRIEALRHQCESTTTADETDTSAKKVSEKSSSEKLPRKLVDKGVQPVKKIKIHPCATESSEVITSTDIPGTSSDSAACKVLKKIKNECEKYHQKRCKIHGGKKCDGQSSTAINCDQCRRVHHCQCRSHKSKNHKKSTDKMQKSPIAYNLILQTSESVMSEGPSEQTRTLKNVIVKVPKKKPHSCMPFRELVAKFEKHMSGPSKEGRCHRSQSLPNDSEISSMEEIIRQSQGATVREYLEKNRPDFIEKCSQRQTCMRYISESRCEDARAPSNLKMVIVHTPNCTGNCNAHCGGGPTVPMTCMSTQCIEPRVVNIETGVARIANERAVKRDLLSLHVAQLPDVTELDSEELRCLAADLGRYMRRKQPTQKFISEREMKKHSEKIYKSLPEVVQKKEEKRKETVKKTNLLMADIFKRNLQKKTLRGSVNISNYSSVIKI